MVVSNFLRTLSLGCCLFKVSIFTQYIHIRIDFQQQQQPRPFPPQMMGGMMGMNPAFGGMPMGAGQDSIQMQEMFRQQQEQMAAMQYMMTQMVQAVQTGGQQMVRTRDLC